MYETPTVENAILTVLRRYRAAEAASVSQATGVGLRSVRRALKRMQHEGFVEMFDERSGQHEAWVLTPMGMRHAKRLKKLPLPLLLPARRGRPSHSQTAILTLLYHRGVVTTPAFCRAYPQLPIMKALKILNADRTIRCAGDSWVLETAVACVGE